MHESHLPQTGTRIRDRRLDQGLRQADLAKAVGVSPSYLNLIEHNKRRIAGTLLVDIAQALDVTPAQLSEGAERVVLDQMLAAAASLDIPAETDKIDELAARYPGWAKVIAGQVRDREALWTRVQELTDRMTHDPALSTALHQVISAVTSIRSTASILTSDEALDADWLGRFHRNIHDDARRLADSSQSLIRFLDAPEAQQDGALSPFAEAERAIDLSLNKNNNLQDVGDVLSLSLAAQELMKIFTTKAQALEHILPMATFAPAAANAHYDVERLSQDFDTPLVDVMRQIAAIPHSDGAPLIGLVECDASGAITYLKRASGFDIARGGLACPLWPLFTALGQPGRPVRRDVIMPDGAARPMRCIAFAEQKNAVGFDMPPVMRSTMLVLTEPTDPEPSPLPLGPSCRICPRSGCAARREPSVMIRKQL